MPTFQTSLRHLPTELLIAIFELATYSPVRDIESLVSCPPFEQLYSSAASAQCEDALRTKHSLALVCPLFRRLSSEFLYEDIWIRHGSDGLLEAVENSKVEDDQLLGLGRFVKRVSLSAVGFEGGQLCGSIFKNTRRILLCCPNVLAISRLQEKFLEDEDEFPDGIPPIDDLQFPFLQRVDWRNHVFAPAPLPRFIWTLSSLRVLIVGADNFPSFTGEQIPETVVNLPNVHTLGIHSVNTFGLEQRRYSVELPSLRRLIIAKPGAIYNLFDGSPLARYGPQITTVEVGADIRFLRHDFVATLLSYCPNAAKLYMPVFSTRPMCLNSPESTLEYGVKQVYLHGAPGSAGHGYNEPLWRKLLGEHFDGLCGQGTRFSALKQITLSGAEWQETVRNVWFDRPLRLARSRGIELVSDIWEVQNLLSDTMKNLG